MKMLISVFALTLTFTAAVKAHATDRKIGNVIAVERTINNIYQDCVDQFIKRTSESNFFSCTFNARKSNADIAPSAQKLLALSTPACQVEGTLENSVILVIIQVESTKANPATAKTCLKEALNTSTNKDSFKFLMYTVE